MPHKILAFGASNSIKSINKKLAFFTANQVPDAEINFLDLNDFEMHIYSVDRERENGFPEEALKFKEYIKSSDGIIISFAEHNGAYTAAFKNILDWVSRIEKSMWHDKPLFLMATSPGSRGGGTVLKIAVDKFQWMNAGSISSFSLPFFNDNFEEGKGITNLEQLDLFHQSLSEFVDKLS